MTDRPKTHRLTDAEAQKAIVNDSLGTTDPADSTGLDEAKETGDAKTNLKDKGRQD